MGEGGDLNEVPDYGNSQIRKSEGRASGLGNWEGKHRVTRNRQTGGDPHLQIQEEAMISKQGGVTVWSTEDSPKGPRKS